MESSVIGGRIERQTLSRGGSLVLILALAVAAYGNSLSNAFFGSDTWPWLVSTRLADVGDVFRVAFSPIMSGTSFVAEVALFYHPLTALSYSLDQALFGLNASAFYATNLAIHLAAVAALYALARGLGASWWAASLCALVLALHPIAAATVPSLPRRQDLVVGALLLGSMALLTRAGIAETRFQWGPLVGALALFFLALGGKEIAYAGLAAIPFVIAGSVQKSGRTVERSQILARALPILVAFVLVEFTAFAIRWRVLGGLGGYYGSDAVRASSEGVLEYFVRPYIATVLWPFHSVIPGRLRDLLLVAGVLAIVIGLATLSLGEKRRLLVVLGLAWQAAFLLLYAVVHTSLSPYLLYVPLAGAALLAAALLDGAADRVRGGVRLGLGDLCPGLAATASLVLVVAVIRSSTLLNEYPEFHDASIVSKGFIEQAMPCITALPPDVALELHGLPHRIDYGSAESQFMDAYVFEPYSVESVARLFAPNAAARLDVRSSEDVRARPNSVSVTCDRLGGRWQMTVVVGTSG